MQLVLQWKPIYTNICSLHMKTTLCCTKQYKLQLIILIYNLLPIFCIVKGTSIQRVWLKQHYFHNCRPVHKYICNLFHITEIFSLRCDPIVSILFIVKIKVITRFIIIARSMFLQKNKNSEKKTSQVFNISMERYWSMSDIATRSFEHSASQKCWLCFIM